MNGIEYIRVIRPFITEQSCLKCHEHQEYKVGDIRGGLSIYVPVTGLNNISAKEIKQLIINYLAILIIGILIIIFIMNKLNKQILSQEKTELLLKESEEKFRGLFSHMDGGFALHEVIYDSALKAIDYKIINTNPAFEKTCWYSGRKKQEMHWLPNFMVFHLLHFWIFICVLQKQVSLILFKPIFQPLDKHFEISVFFT